MKHTLRNKATSSYQDALHLVASQRYNSAASRAYYALYQALVTYWEEQGYEPQDVDQIMSTEIRTVDNEARWRHGFILSNLSKMKLSRDQEMVIKDAWRLRVKADYRPDDVKSEVVHIINAIPAIFDRLGKIAVK